MSLYKATDGVIILTDKNFKNGKLSSNFKGPGVLKAYAPWCPHCRDKVSDFKQLAADFKKENTGVHVYVIDGDSNREFSQNFGVQFFPCMYYIDDDRSIKKLTDKQGNPVSSPGSIVDSVCLHYKKLCS